MPEPLASSTDPVRLIQVGAGSMGRAWLSTIAASPDAELVGLVDLDVAAARSAADAAGFPGVEVATTVAELAERTGAQAVVDVAVPKAHHPVNTEALLAGLPVLCEKPLADSLAECLSMVATSELSGQLLMVSQSRRYWSHLVPLRRQLAELGTVSTASCSFAKGPHFGGFRETMPYPLLVDMAIHQFDLARDLIGSEPVAVCSDSYNPAWSWYAGDAAAVAVFRFANGARFTFDGNWVAGGLETSWNGSWRIAAEHGTATWDGDSAPEAVRSDGGIVEAPTAEVPEQIAGSLAEFVDALRTGRRPSGEVHGNVLSVAMVAAAVESAESGGWIEVGDVLERAWTDAAAAERRPEVREVLRGWASVQSVVGLA